MIGLDQELRLAAAVLLNAAVFASAYRFARRRGEAGTLQAICDAFLIYFVVQYVSVALPGALGVFNVWTMSLVALIAVGACWKFAGRSAPPCLPWTADHVIFIAAFTFTATYLLAHFYDKRFHPPLATDAIVYHIPTAVQWLQTGKLGLFPTWYWNPAATYSPATSSTFMAWLMAPQGNDVFVRFVQGPPLLFIFFLVARLCRELGTTRAVAGLVALAAVMSRPFFSEAMIPKDDLFITAFFAAAVLSLTPSNLKDRHGPWRVGLAFGMVLACKYTVLLVCPLFVFMIEAPFRAGWRLRHWLIALGVGIPLFAPWYIRNIVLTGNPLYPVDVKLFGHIVFPGLFGTERDLQLRTTGGVFKMLGLTYHSIPVALLIPLALGWLAAVAGAGKRVLRDPLRRACLLGTAVTFVVFLLTSPHHEVRYMYPLLLLVFATVGLALARWIAIESGRIAIAAALAVLSIATAFAFSLAGHIAMLQSQAVLLTLLLLGAAFSPSSMRRVSIAIVSIVVACGVYVLWAGYLKSYYVKSSDGADAAPVIPFAWSHQYADEAPLWTFVREHLPDDANLAIANTFFVYPFQDATFQRRLAYAPTRQGLHDFLHFPRMGDTVPGDVIVQRMTDVMNEESDKATWLENLSRMKAQYLVIAGFVHESNPPERRFVSEEPQRFEKLFDDASGTVYRIISPPAP